MKKTFCDCCERQITQENHPRFCTEIHNKRGAKLGTVAAHCKYEGGVSRDICRHCLIDAIKRADNRPEAL